MTSQTSISWSHAARTALLAGAALTFLSACTASGDWWRAFRSTKLDAAMQKAIADNLDFAAANATIAQASDTVAAAQGGLRPQLDFGASGGRQGASDAATDIYTAGPSVSFDFDIFGGDKRLIEERAALAELQQHRYDAAYLTLTGDVVSQALPLASAQALIGATQRLLEQDRETLELVRAGHKFGSATRVDIALAEAQLAQDPTLMPPLAQQRDRARHALSVLAGKGPADWAPPDFVMTDFTVPTNVPVRCRRARLSIAIPFNCLSRSAAMSHTPLCAEWRRTTRREPPNLAAAGV